MDKQSQAVCVFKEAVKLFRRIIISVRIDMGELAKPFGMATKECSM